MSITWMSIQVHGLSVIVDIPENNGDYSISYDFTSGHYHADLQPDSRLFDGLKVVAHTTNTIALHLVYNCAMGVLESRYRIISYCLH
jgi:hypothetical protein